MTTMSTRVAYASLSASEFRERLPEAVALYVDAMGYPTGTAEKRTPMWLAHILREGWRNVVAVNPAGSLVGIAYGYRGLPGQWWHEQVRQGLRQHMHRGGRHTAALLENYFELTELHVRPECQGGGIGEALLRRLLADLPQSCVLLSTPEGTNRAWRLYRRTGFGDVLRDYHFAGDPRPFAILGRPLPL